jgi:hypothetical protein
MTLTSLPCKLCETSIYVTLRSTVLLFLWKVIFIMVSLPRHFHRSILRGKKKKLGYTPGVPRISAALIIFLSLGIEREQRW